MCCLIFGPELNETWIEVAHWSEFDVTQTQQGKYCKYSKSVQNYKTNINSKNVPWLSHFQVFHDHERASVNLKRLVLWNIQGWHVPIKFAWNSSGPTATLCITTSNCFAIKAEWRFCLIYISYHLDAEGDDGEPLIHAYATHLSVWVRRDARVACSHSESYIHTKQWRRMFVWLLTACVKLFKSR